MMTGGASGQCTGGSPNRGTDTPGSFLRTVSVVKSCVADYPTTHPGQNAGASPEPRVTGSPGAQRGRSGPDRRRTPVTHHPGPVAPRTRPCCVQPPKPTRPAGVRCGPAGASTRPAWRPPGTCTAHHRDQERWTSTTKASSNPTTSSSVMSTSSTGSSSASSSSAQHVGGLTDELVTRPVGDDAEALHRRRSSCGGDVSNRGRAQS